MKGIMINIIVLYYRRVVRARKTNIFIKVVVFVSPK